MTNRFFYVINFPVSFSSPILFFSNFYVYFRKKNLRKKNWKKENWEKWKQKQNRTQEQIEKKGEEKEVEIRSLFWKGKTEERIRLGGDD